MLDLKFVRENPDIVKQNIKNKFQDKKIPLVDEVIELDAKNRAAKKEADDLRANKNKIAKMLLFTHTCPVTSFLHFETKQDRLPIIFNSTSSNRTGTPPGTVRPAPGHQVLLSFPHIFL